MQPKTLTIGIATRGRPKLCSWTATDTLKSVREKGTKIVVLADHDDDLTELVLPEGVMLNIQQREDSVAAKWNRMMTVAPADVYMAACDYRPQITPGFDTNILKAASVFYDGIGCVYQELANLSFPTFQCMTAKMASVMGHFYVEHFPYWFVDHWLDDLCRMIGRFAYAEGTTEVGVRPGKGTMDFREPGFWATLYDAQYQEREAMAEKLMSEMDITDGQRNLLRSQWPLIHQRSRMINDIVRGMQGNAEFDERYMRIRERGITKLHGIYNQLQEAA